MSDIDVLMENMTHIGVIFLVFSITLWFLIIIYRIIRRIKKEYSQRKFYESITDNNDNGVENKSDKERKSNDDVLSSLVLFEIFSKLFGK